MANETYAQWLARQDPDRQRASLDVMEVCTRLGEIARVNPRSPEADMLRRKIRDHNERWPGVPEDFKGGT